MGAPPTTAEVIAGILAGDRRSLARAISLAEDGTPEGREIVTAIMPRTGRAVSVGITGPPGVGKSTLVGGLIRMARAEKRSVGVLSVDPSSPVTRGALLGDRIRLTEHFLDEEVFIRSMGNRGHAGGVAEATLQAALMLDAAGKDIILLETVGVGQAEIDVRAIADIVVLVLMPGSGDAIQALKAGILEIPDLIVLNKGDLGGVEGLLRDLRLAHGADGDDGIPILVASAREGTGLEEIWRAVVDLHSELEDSGALAHRRRRNLVDETVALAEGELGRTLARLVREDVAVQLIIDAVERRELDPPTAASRLVDALLGNGEREADTH